MIPHGVEVFVGLEPIDLRWGFDRLSGIVADRLSREPRCGALFLFFGKRRDALKVLFFDGTGLCLFYKRLDKGTFRLPLAPEGTTQLTIEERFERQQIDVDPFPFIGAGEANYFEWADLHVNFARAPKPAERAAIVKRVPVPLADSADWEGTHLYVASAQGVGRVIHAAYARPPKRPTGLTTTSRFKIAGSSRTSRFNADTERWLEQAHAIVPIVAAYRRQDWEAGGTTLSAWHLDSLKHVPAILKQLGKPKKGAAVASLVDGLQAELANAAKLDAGPDAEELVGDLMGSLMNAKRAKKELAAALTHLDAIEALASADAWWLAAREIADHVACFRGDDPLAHAGIRAIALRVFRGALVGATPKAHAAAFQFIVDDGFPKWHLARTITIALETALRAGDAKAFAHFKKGVARTMASELERAAAACDEAKQPAIARKLRALA
ncbi:MAG: IS66 family insertion sequence element accessory protein TnpB [Proteobacteria bacterium]|nr:IS66 family insertion sequence element accessory protein TnpB [Pseudomonadota bacterium]